MMLADITDLSWSSSAYPYQAPDAPETEVVICQMCGEDMNEDEVLRNEWYCDHCLAEMEYMEVDE